MVNVVDLKKIKEYKEMFESEKKEFKNSSYSTFSNSYIKKSSDPYMQRMSSKLDKIYLNINSAYDTIKKWWDEYIENIEEVDKKIVNNSSLSKSIDKIKNDFLSSLKDSIISKDLEEMKNDFSKKIENFNKIAAENPELADAINTVMREHPEYDFESYCERCMNDPSFVDNVMTAADNINKQKAEEKYAEDHPIKSSKFVKGASKFFSGAKEIYFDAGENLFGMGLNLANGVETGFKNVEGFFNYVFYANGWLDAQDYIELEQDKKKNEWFDDDVVNDFINNDTSLNDTKYSKTVNSIVGSIGEQIFPLLTTIVGGPLGGLLGGAIDGVGRGSGDSLKHQKEAMNGIPTEIGTDIKNGTVTYLYEGNKIVVDSTGNIISSMKMDESEYNKMLAKYINKTDISKGALLQGTWDAATWAAGGLLSGAKIVAKPFLNSTIKIGIDASMGGAETPIQALIQSTYAQFYVDENGNKVYYDKDASFGDKFEHAFSEKGGWKSVAEGAAMAAAMSTVGEAADVSKKMKTQKEYRTMIDENPNAAAKKLTEFGFSEQEAVNALNKYSTKELAEKAAMLEEFSLSNNKKAFDSEFNKMKESINDNNLDIKTNKVEKSLEKFKENAKNIMNDNSGKFNIDAFKEKFNGKSNNIDIDIDDIRRDYNIILNSEAEIDINIKNAIDYTLRKNGITPTKELIDRYYLEVQKGNYSVITRDRGWRQYVDDAINYKNNIQSQKIEYKKILDQSGLSKFDEYMLSKYNMYVTGESIANNNIHGAIERSIYEYTTKNNLTLTQELHDKLYDKYYRDIQIEKYDNISDGWKNAVIEAEKYKKSIAYEKANVDRYIEKYIKKNNNASSGVFDKFDDLSWEIDRLNFNRNNAGKAVSWADFDYERLISEKLKSVQKQLQEISKEKLSKLTNSFESLDVNGQQRFGADQGIMRQLDCDSYMYIADKLEKKYGLSYKEASLLIDGMDTSGACTYAAIANEIFSYYMDNPAKFANDFGFSMFKEVNGVATLNTEELIIDLYFFANHESNGGRLITSAGNKNILTNEAYTTSKNGATALNSSRQIYLSFFDGANEYTIDKYLKSKNINLGYSSNVIASNVWSNSWPLKNISNTINKEISSGNSLTLNFGPKGDNHIFMKNLSGGPDVSTSAWHEGGGHAVFITGVLDDGFEVSSWGQKYKITFADLENARFTILNCNIKNGGK